MTKKHFKALAKILAHAQATAAETDEELFIVESQRQSIGNALVSFCREQNPLFDEAKFRQAAKLPE